MEKKIAFFVEGMTEQVFLKYILRAVFGPGATIVENQIRGGSSCPISVTTISVTSATGRLEYYFLIYDCGGDSGLNSFINEQEPTLIVAGYTLIIGLRDLYPLPLTDLTKLKEGLVHYSSSKIPTDFAVSVMETEAWFLADYQHFEKIDPLLTAQYITHHTGVDYSTVNIEAIAHPSENLNRVYQLAGKTYLKNGKKKKVKVLRTCSVLDYSNIYLSLKNSLPSLKDLVDKLDTL